MGGVREAAVAAGPAPSQVFGVRPDEIVPGPESSPVAIAAFLLLGTAVTVLILAVLVRLTPTGYRLSKRLMLWLDGRLPLSVPSGAIATTVAMVVVALLLVASTYGALLGTKGVLWGPGAGGDGPDRSVLPLDDVAAVDEGYEGPSHERPGPDADGDGLPDTWERAGETPDGVELPDADPQHKDLYVQVNYGTTARPLSDEERADLRRIWAGLPVENPDGEPGVTLHLDDEAPHGGEMDVLAQVSDRERAVERYYTEQYLGDRRCRYHQVVLGSVALGETVAVGATPGYGSVVDSGRRPGFEADASWRVYAVTHVLLHNVVGPRGERYHTDGGWLDTPLAPDDDYLSEPVANKLSQQGFAGSAYYQHEVCGA